MLWCFLRRCLLLLTLLVLIVCCGNSDTSSPSDPVVPHEDRWGIYGLDMQTEEIELVYSSSEMVSGLDLDGLGNRFVFSQRIGDHGDQDEICIVNSDGTSFRRLTANDHMDTYPCWSPDGTRIVFLSWSGEDLDIYVMDTDGENQRMLYDSGSHDADVDWVGESIVFTRDSQIWIMNSSGAGARQVTSPPNAGEWGDAVLPFGDYDPKLSPDGSAIAFERLEDDETTHGNYDIYLIDSDGTNERALTSSGYTQGLARWSNSGTRIVYIVSAIGNDGQYDLYTMNTDGTMNQNITPAFFPAEFLCRSPIFSTDDEKVYFLGEWWE